MLNISGQWFLLCPFGSNAPLHFEHWCSGHAKLLAFRWSELPHASHTALSGQLFLFCPSGSSAPLHFEHVCSGHAKLLEFRWSELPHGLSCRVLCIVDCIRARNGRFHRMYCTLGTDMSLVAGDAKRLRRFGAISTVGANHRACDTMLIRFRFLLIRFLYAAALLGPPLTYLLT